MNEHTNRTQDREIASRGLQGVREAAQRDRGLRFTTAELCQRQCYRQRLCPTLLHHVNGKLLLDSFYLLKRQAAPGVDRVTWGEYEEGVEARIEDLHDRIHRGAYRAQPSRRVYIPKPDGRQRPLGIAALEDKIVQQAVVEVLNQIYEGDFAGFSYGFRPGHSAHGALDALSAGIMTKKVNWILDADIKGFFDNISHEKLMEWIERRIADPRILRLIRKWLTAGVSEDGQWSETKVGTPQGAVRTPRTQKVTSSLSGVCGFCGNRVRIDSCRTGLYVYDRCREPARPKKPNVSIVRATCFDRSIVFPKPLGSWRRTVPFLNVRPIATSSKLSS